MEYAPVVVGALSTAHTIGLGVVALIFILFALCASFVAPRRRPDFPGKNGLRWFVTASFVLFAAMLAAVVIFGAEQQEAIAKVQAVAAGKPVAVTENEFHVILAQKSLKPGAYTFVVKNAGKIQHDLAVQGGSVNTKTPLINPGATAKLTVTLPAGTYTLFCTVPGHRAAGMVAKLTVG
jgi:plastocyanin